MQELPGCELARRAEQGVLIEGWALTMRCKAQVRSTQNNGALLVKANEVKCILADVDADRRRSFEAGYLAWHGMLLMLQPRNSLAAGRGGSTTASIPLASVLECSLFVADGGYRFHSFGKLLYLIPTPVDYVLACWHAELATSGTCPIVE